MIKRILSLVALSTALNGCATSTQSPEVLPTNETRDYICQAGETITIGKVSVRAVPGQVVLQLGREEYTMPRVRSASGTKYANEIVSWWSHGNEAILQFEALEEAVHCRLK